MGTGVAPSCTGRGQRCSLRCTRARFRCARMLSGSPRLGRREGCNQSPHRYERMGNPRSRTKGPFAYAVSGPSLSRPRAMVNRLRASGHLRFPWAARLVHGEPAGRIQRCRCARQEQRNSASRYRVCCADGPRAGCSEERSLLGWGLYPAKCTVSRPALCPTQLGGQVVSLPTRRHQARAGLGTRDNVSCEGLRHPSTLFAQRRAAANWSAGLWCSRCSELPATRPLEGTKCKAQCLHTSLTSRALQSLGACRRLYKSIAVGGLRGSGLCSYIFTIICTITGPTYIAGWPSSAVDKLMQAKYRSSSLRHSSLRHKY